MRVDTLITNTLSEREAHEAKNVYVGSTEQPNVYETPASYAVVVSDLIASMEPRSVLEFGCNAGRNLVLLRDKLPAAALTGVDVNPEAIRLGKEIYELDLTLADEDWLTRQSDDAFDVSLTISVVDHMPYPETVLRHLLRVTKHYLVLFELVHDRIGKTTHNLYLDDAQATLKPAYRYSYTHDYRYECERKFGAHCLLDAKFPIGPDNLLDLYRLFVFSKRRDFRERSVIRSVRMTPIDD